MQQPCLTPHEVWTKVLCIVIYVLNQMFHHQVPKWLDRQTDRQRVKDNVNRADRNMRECLGSGAIQEVSLYRQLTKFILQTTEVSNSPFPQLTISLKKKALITQFPLYLYQDRDKKEARIQGGKTQMAWEDKSTKVNIYWIYDSTAQCSGQVIDLKI